MNILIAPDSFKGSLTSNEICQILAEGLSRLLPDAKITCIPMADGGEGTLDAFNAAKPGQIVYAKATDPWFNETEVPYLFYENATASNQNMHGTGIPTAIIESAKVAGYISPAAKDTGDSGTGTEEPDPKLTSTYGVGLLIKDAISRGAKKIIIGLGGSCTNDGGCGMATALGTKFYGIPEGTDSTASFIPTGGALSKIAHIDNRGTMELLGGTRSLFEGKAVDIVGMCDVSNPLFGENGASHVFAPQKGASEKDVLLLDEGLKHLVSAIDDGEAVSPGTILFPGNLKADALAKLPGSGSAGGLGFGIRAFAGGRLERGIDLMLDTIDFDGHLWNADCVITGEGRFDSQSLQGKVVSGICQRAKAANIPVIILCGTSADFAGNGDHANIIEAGFIDFANLTGEEAKNRAEENLINVLPSLAKLLKRM